MSARDLGLGGSQSPGAGSADCMSTESAQYTGVGVVHKASYSLPEDYGCLPGTCARLIVPAGTDTRIWLLSPRPAGVGAL